MKKRNLSIIITLALAIIVAACMPASAATFTPKAGLYYVKAYDNVTFHTYTTPIKFAASASVVMLA